MSQPAPPSAIVGTGHYVPQRVVTNEELAETLGTTAQWIEERSGIRQRHFVDGGVGAADLGLEAARRALDDAQLGAEALDAIIFATLSADAFFPGSGVFLQRELGLVGTPALDVRNQCSGFLYGMSIADAWLRAGVYRHVLLVGAEAHSPGLEFTPRGRDVTALFGDGAGAVVLTRREAPDATTPSIVDVRLGADGRGAEKLWCEQPGSTCRPHIDHDALDAGRHFPQMEGRAVFRRAVSTLTREIGALLDDHGLEVDDELLVIPHQANRRINEMVASSMGLPEERVVHTIGAFGNTTAASIPMALDIARRDGRVARHRRVVMAAFGSGYTWATALIEV